MTTAFEACVLKGGRTTAVKLKGGKYLRVCYDENGKAHTGPICDNPETADSPKRPEVARKKQRPPKPKPKPKSSPENAPAMLDGVLKLKDHFNNNYHN